MPATITWVTALAPPTRHHGIPGKGDLRVGSGPLAQEGVARTGRGDGHRHLAGEVRQKKGLLDGRVAAADDDDLPVSKEGPVAGGAVRNAPPRELGLAGHSDLRQLAPVATMTERASKSPASVLTRQPAIPAMSVFSRPVTEAPPRKPEFLCLLLERLHEP